MNNNYHYQGSDPIVNTGKQIAKTAKSNAWVIITAAGIFIAVTTIFVGVVFLIISAVMSTSAEKIKDYDEVTAIIVGTERTGSYDDYKYVTRVRYSDKEDNEYTAELSGIINAETVTIYCDPNNYSNYIYVSQPGGMDVMTSIFNGIAIALIAIGILVGIGGVIGGIVLRKRSNRI